MKNVISPTRSRFTRTALFFCASALVGLSTGNAAVLSWDPNGTTSVGGNGTWDTTTKNWSSTANEAQTNSSALVAWNTSDAALFCAGPGASTNQGSFTVTVNSSVAFAGIFNGALNPGPCTVTFTGSGSLSLASGLQGFDTYNVSLGNTIFNVPITGSGAPTMENSGQTYFNVANSYTGGTYLGYSGASYTGLLNFSNNSSFGTGGIFISNCNGCALVSEGSSAITIGNPVTVNAIGANVSVNIVGNPAGVTFNGNWTLGTNTPKIGSGGAANNLVIIGGVISSTTGGFWAWNTGTLEFNNTMTYSGPTTISNTVTLALGPNGAISGTGLVTVQTNSTLADLNTSGTRSIAGAVTFQGANGAGRAAAKALFNAAGGPSSTVGSISVGGNLTLATTPITVNVTGSPLSAGSYTLLSCTGTLSSSANTTPTITGTPLGYGYTANISTAAKSVVLNVALTPPTVSCPSNITTNAPATGDCGQTVAFGAPTTNATPMSISTNLGATNGPAISSPFDFPVGVNKVYYTVSNAAGSQSCFFTVTVNDPDPPAGGNFAMNPVENSPESVPVGKILSVASNPRGGTLSIIGVTSPTAHGATVGLGGGLLTYTPAAGFAGPDTINYQISDGCGFGNGSITVNVTPSNAGTGNYIATYNGYTLNLTFFGVPGTSYHIQQSTPAPNGPWANIAGPLTADAIGQIPLIITNPPTPSFYRTTQP